MEILFHGLKLQSTQEGCVPNSHIPWQVPKPRDQTSPHYEIPSPVHHHPTHSLLPSHQWAMWSKTRIPFPFPSYLKRGNFELLVGDLLPAVFTALCLDIFQGSQSWLSSTPWGFHRCNGEVNLCVRFGWFAVSCHRGIEVITREFPQIGGCCGVVPGSFGFLIKLKDQFLLLLKSLGTL